MNTKKIVLAGLVLCIGVTIVSCNRNKSEINTSNSNKPQLVQRSNFVGTDSQYEKYKNMLVSQSVSKMNDEEYEEYIDFINRKDVQEGVIKDFERQESYKLERSEKVVLPLEKDGKVIESTRAQGTYPRWRGAILVTDEPNSSQNFEPVTSFGGGHAAIVYDYNQTIEAMPNGGVQKLDNN